MTLYIYKLKEIGPNDKFERLPPIQIGFEIQNRQKELVERTTKITFINDLMLSLPQGNTAVRNNQMIQENGLLGVRMVVNNWGKSGWEDAIYQGLCIVKQTEPYSYSQAEEHIEGEFEQLAVSQAVKKAKKHSTLQTRKWTYRV